MYSTIIYLLVLLSEGTTEWLELPVLVPDKSLKNQRIKLENKMQKISSTTEDPQLLITEPIKIINTTPVEHKSDEQLTDKPKYVLKEIQFNSTSINHGFNKDYDSSDKIKKINSSMNNQDCGLTKTNVTYHIFEPHFRDSLKEFQRAWIKEETLSDKSLKNLTDLQIILLSSIKKKSEDLWLPNTSRNDARSLKNFHSLEGSLVTISILTFAVFLIKLVKQFILGINGNQPIIGTGTTGTTILRQKRTIDSHLYPIVLQSLYEFKKFKNFS